MISRVASLLIILLAADGALSQARNASGPQWENEEQLGKPSFEVRILQRATDPAELCRLNVMFEIVFDHLQFVRNDSNLFEAGVEATLSLSHPDSGQVLKEFATLNVNLPNFEKTNSRRDYLSGQFILEAAQGDYTLEIALRDRESKRMETLKRKAHVARFGDESCSISDLVIARTREFHPETQGPSNPILGPISTDVDSLLYVFFDLYTANPTEPVTIYYSLVSRDGVVAAGDSASYVGGDPITSHFLPLQVAGLSFGRYDLRLEARTAAATVEKRLQLQFSQYGLPGTIADLDEAIRQLRYVSKAEEIKFLQDQFPSEREAAFIAFWNKNFPTPGESVNGKMLEYYARAASADESFGGSRRGWETDRGRVLMLFGKPSDIERREADGQPPLEVWTYSHLGRQFLFRDDYGFGDYRLVTPVW